MSESERTNAQLSSGQQEQAFMQVRATIYVYPFFLVGRKVLTSGKATPFSDTPAITPSLPLPLPKPDPNPHADGWSSAQLLRR